MKSTLNITRRQVVAAAAAVPVVGGLAAGTTVWRWWDRPAGEGLKMLSAEEHTFIQALAEAWMPPGGTPALSGADARLGDWMDDVVNAMEPQTAKELKLLMHAMDALPLATRLRPFHSLPLESRTAVLNGWIGHPVSLVRDGISGILVLMGIGWTTHPDVVPIFRSMFRCGYGR